MNVFFKMRNHSDGGRVQVVRDGRSMRLKMDVGFERKGKGRREGEFSFKPH